jgi:hypothetical protein
VLTATPIIHYFKRLFIGIEKIPFVNKWIPEYDFVNIYDFYNILLKS